MQSSSSAAAITQAEVIRDCLKFIFDRVYIALVDRANGRISAIRQMINLHGVEYLQKDFQRKLEAGTIKLVHLEACIAETVQTLFKSGSLAHADKQVLVHIVIGICCCCKPHNTIRFPETFERDKARLLALNSFFHMDVVHAVIMVTLQTLFASAGSHENLVLLCRIADKMIKFTSKQWNTLNCINMVMEELQHLQDTDRIRSMLVKHTSQEHSVYICLHKKFEQYWFQFVLGSSEPHLKLPEAARVIVENTKQQAAHLRGIVGLSRKVHGVVYDSLISLEVEKTLSRVNTT